jgi:hypothetical protein
MHDLIQTKLAGRKIDVVGFVDALLALAKEAGEIRSGLATEQSLHFALGDQAFEVELDAARAKLRMLCARLSVLCKATGGGAVSPYAGEGIIAAPGTPPEQWAVRFKNTPDEQQFTVRLVEAAVPLPNGAAHDAPAADLLR